MGLAAETKRMSYAEYLALERETNVRHEWLRGEVWAMAGGSPEHSVIAGNVIHELRLALRERPCTVHTSDLKVRIDETDRGTYPDVTVVCGKRELSQTDPNAVTNPVVIVEVLSDTTEASDRGEKFAHYRRLSSLRAYVLVSQHDRRVEVFHRDAAESSWTFEEHGAGQRVVLRALDVELDVDALYRDPSA